MFSVFIFYFDKNSRNDIFHSESVNSCYFYLLLAQDLAGGSLVPVEGPFSPLFALEVSVEVFYLEVVVLLS